MGEMIEDILWRWAQSEDVSNVSLEWDADDGVWEAQVVFRENLCPTCNSGSWKMIDGRGQTMEDAVDEVDRKFKEREDGKG